MSNPVIVPISEWDSNSKCHKCESQGDDLSIIWIKTGEGKVNGVDYAFEDMRKGVPYEHLMYSCKVCGYQWLSETSDSSDRSEAMDKESVAEDLKAKDAEAMTPDEETPSVSEGKAEPSIKGHLRRMMSLRSRPAFPRPGKGSGTPSIPDISM
jgi:hypothetical protein